MDGELTVAILREIRDEIRTTNSQIGALDRSLSGRIDETNARLDILDHTVRDLAEQMLTVTRYVKDVANRHDDAIDDLRLRVGKPETRGG